MGGYKDNFALPGHSKQSGKLPGSSAWAGTKQEVLTVCLHVFPGETLCLPRGENEDCALPRCFPGPWHPTAELAGHTEVCALPAAGAAQWEIITRTCSSALGSVSLESVCSHSGTTGTERLPDRGSFPTTRTVTATHPGVSQRPQEPSHQARCQC